MIELIKQKLVAYNAANQLEEEHALKEIIQDIALYGLWRTGFFELAAFQGGTSLRILYGMTRFSENLDFPLDFEVCHQDLASNFSLKIHALLCRPYLKGRDWYDFNWYVKQGAQPNIPHLQAALMQWGPWQGQDCVFDMAWLQQALTEKIAHIEWKDAVLDVEHFLSMHEQHSLKMWSSRFFLSKVARLQEE